MCVFSCRRNERQCWGIGGEDRAKGAGWTNLAAPKARADDAKGGESKRRRCGSRGAKPVGRRGWEPRGWTEGPGARAARKRVRPSTASASPRGDRAHAFLAGSQKSAGARLALERIAPSLSRSLRRPPPPAFSTRLFLRVRRDLALVWVLVRVVSRAAPPAAALSCLPRRAAPRRAENRSRETSGAQTSFQRALAATRSRSALLDTRVSRYRLAFRRHDPRILDSWYCVTSKDRRA